MGRDLFGCVFIGGEFDHLAGHLIYGRDDLEHLVVGDEAVLVYVIELECPCGGVRWSTMDMRGHTLELFVQTAAACDAECADELFKVDCPVLVFVKDVEDIVCELAGVTERKELLVYVTEFGAVELAGWTVLEEALVPRGRSEQSGGSERGRRDHCCSSRLSTGRPYERVRDVGGTAYSRCSFVDLRVGLRRVLTGTFPLSTVVGDGRSGSRPG